MKPCSPSGAKLVVDARNQHTILFTSEWTMRQFQKQYPGIGLSDAPFKEATPQRMTA